MINSKEEKNISQNEKKLNYNNHSQDELVSILNNLIAIVAFLISLLQPTGTGN